MSEHITGCGSFYEAVLKQAVIQDCIRELEELPSEQDLENALAYSSRHVSRMKKLFLAESRRERARLFLSATRKAAAVVAILLVILFGMLMLDPNVRAVVVDTIIEWFETFARFQSPQSEKAEFDTSWRPSYVPEGFAEAYALEDADLEMVTIMYRSGPERISLVYAPIDAALSVDNEELDYTELLVDGILFHVFQSASGDKGNRLMWEEGSVRFYLTSTTPIDELILMAQSVSRE